MKYLCLVYLNEREWESCPPENCAAYVQRLADSKQLLAAEPLYPPETAKTVRVVDGQISIFDGPFAETKECLAGFYLVDARDFDEALRIASAIPTVKYGSVEVRQVQPLDDLLQKV